MDLEYLMRDDGFWSDAAPTDWALASELPFAHDRMEFPEWLQHVFIPTLDRLAETGGEWPRDCAVTPMAEYYFGGKGLAVERLLLVLTRIDELVSACADADETLFTETE